MGNSEVKSKQEINRTISRKMWLKYVPETFQPFSSGVALKNLPNGPAEMHDHLVGLWHLLRLPHMLCSSHRNGA